MFTSTFQICYTQSKLFDLSEFCQEVHMSFIICTSEALEVMGRDRAFMVQYWEYEIVWTSKSCDSLSNDIAN